MRAAVLIALGILAVLVISGCTTNKLDLIQNPDIFVKKIEESRNSNYELI